MTMREKISSMNSAAVSPSTVAHGLLFGPLGSTDVTSAVVHRLRAAIALGLLPEGGRLPREADLATQMGITTFALREALAELRNQRLLVTRAGKNGGSFVALGAADEDAERAELLSVSSIELRDLADWRKMLAGRAALLAATRGSHSNIDNLRGFAERVATASTSRDARRAHGRFHLELAAAAQSKRLARAEFAMHEELDWLFGLALSTPAERRANADALLVIVDALQRRDATSSRSAAQQQIGALVGRLSQLRLEAMAQQGPKRPRSTMAAQLRTVTNRLLAQLNAVATDAAPALNGGLHFDETRRRLSVATLRRIEDLPPFVTGAGIIAEVGVLREHPHWIQWARRTSTGPVEDMHHITDPQHEDFYDYESMELIAQPRETHQPCAWGPYVDYGGLDDYILSVTMPILDGDRFLGVSCADIPVAAFESWLAPWLAASGEVCLINAEGRVIVSNVLAHSAGDVLLDRGGYDVDDSLHFGWTLLSRPRA